MSAKTSSSNSSRIDTFICKKAGRQKQPWVFHSMLMPMCMCACMCVCMCVSVYDLHVCSVFRCQKGEHWIPWTGYRLCNARNQCWEPTPGHLLLPANSYSSPLRTIYTRPPLEGVVYSVGGLHPSVSPSWKCSPDPPQVTWDPSWQSRPSHK